MCVCEGKVSGKRLSSRSSRRATFETAASENSHEFITLTCDGSFGSFPASFAELPETFSSTTPKIKLLRSDVEWSLRDGSA